MSSAVGLVIEMGQQEENELLCVVLRAIAELLFGSCLEANVPRVILFGLPVS